MSIDIDKVKASAKRIREQMAQMGVGNEEVDFLSLLSTQFIYKALNMACDAYRLRSILLTGKSPDILPSEVRRRILFIMLSSLEEVENVINPK